MSKNKAKKFNKNSAIISSLKRVFSRSPIVIEKLKENRRERPWFKKDGTQAKKPRVEYICENCKKWYMGKDIQVDHKEPVVPVNIPVKHICMNRLIERLFCDIDNLQVLCKSCHKIKSDEENITRRSWKKKDKLKHIIYKTTNTINGQFFLGIHSTYDYDDGILGNGDKFKLAIKQYGSEKFSRKILFVLDTLDKALNKLEEILSTI
jgi:hypothetical protein